MVDNEENGWVWYSILMFRKSFMRASWGNVPLDRTSHNDECLVLQENTHTSVVCLITV